VILIPITQGRFALVDDEDADLRGCYWQTREHYRTFYAARAARRPDGGKTSQLLHRVIAARMGIAGMVDHRDRNGLNCTRGNLRGATPQQNSVNQRMRRDNKSGVKGVHWHVRSGRWRARIRNNGKFIHLGSYTDLAEATAVVRAARERMHGDFACHG